NASLDVRATATNGSITLGSNATISGTSDVNATGDVIYSFQADNISLGASNAIGAGGKTNVTTVSLGPTTAGRAITLGGKSAGTLGLTQAELSSISASGITIGHAGAGDVSTAAALTLPNLNNVSIESGANINLNHAMTLDSGAAL